MIGTTVFGKSAVHVIVSTVIGSDEHRGFPLVCRIILDSNPQIPDEGVCKTDSGKVPLPDTDVAPYIDISQIEQDQGRVVTLYCIIKEVHSNGVITGFEHDGALVRRSVSRVQAVVERAQIFLTQYPPGFELRYIVCLPVILEYSREPRSVWLTRLCTSIRIVVANSAEHRLMSGGRVGDCCRVEFRVDSPHRPEVIPNMRDVLVRRIVERFVVSDPIDDDEEHVFRLVFKGGGRCSTK